ncbi:MAG TPA: DUF2818 family protein [Burkholderiaceae bacterium]|nr:DUF2818 family protein [Burkholderiaceae bacterium]
MEQTASIWLVLLVAAVAANLPFANERLFAVGPRRERKGLGWRVLELLVGFGLTLVVGFALEARLGQRHAQGWEFYAVFGCLFLTLAFPGFVWRYLRRHRG